MIQKNVIAHLWFRNCVLKVSDVVIWRPRPIPTTCTALKEGVGVDGLSTKPEWTSCTNNDLSN